jgi:hypothetical protein
MNTNLDNITFPIKCISYYASDKSSLDGKNSYEFWMRSKLVRIICDRPFSRGDVLEIKSIKDTSSGILIDTILINDWKEEYPVLIFVSGRLIYNKNVDFKYEASEGIQVLKPIEQVLSDNYSLGFIIHCYKAGKIVCNDTVTNNKFDIFINLSWE